MSTRRLAGAARAVCWLALAPVCSATDPDIDRLRRAVNATSAALAAAERELQISEQSMNTFWILVATVLVFFMQAGFALVEAASVRSKNVHNILTKNVLDAAISALVFWLLGYGFAYGDDWGGLIGTSKFALDDSFVAAEGNAFHNWMFQWSFAASAATIVSGAVAERCQFGAYLAYSALITALVYPPVVHWVWGGGFLSQAGFLDFAGSGVVHMVGGLASAIGAYIMGPRKGRMHGGVFRVSVVDDDEFNAGLAPQSSALGVFILWFGWYGFNAGSSLSIYHTGHRVASRAAINTTLAPAGGALTTTLLLYLKSGGRDISLGAILNTVLAALVAITAACAVVQPWAAFVIGVLASPTYLLASQLTRQLRIDDPVDATPIHFFCGMLGLLVVPLFQHHPSVVQAGLPWQGFARRLGSQLLGILAISLWTAATSTALFTAMKMCRMLRVSEEEELRGLDSVHHGIKAGEAGANYELCP